MYGPWVGWLTLTLLIHYGAEIVVGLSAKRSLVWGPGLQSEVVLPVRYFFIQAADKSGRNTSPGENVFSVSISPIDGSRSRIWVQVLDRHDGSFLVRYKMYGSYEDLRISITYKEKHVSKSPFILKGNIYHELCPCAQHDTVSWRTYMQCQPRYEQIERDLLPFPTVDPEKIAQEIPKRFSQFHSLCHYTIKDNKVYRRTFGQHVDFKMFMDAILLSLTRKVSLIKLFLNAPSATHPDICISTHSAVLPVAPLTFSVTLWVSLDLMYIQANTGPVWQNKTNLAFWRGRDSRQERLDLVQMSRKHPHIIDAAITNFFFFKHDEALYGPTVTPISFFDFFNHKYQINLDGTVAAYRLSYLLAGGSLVLKQDSSYYEFFYKDLVPWKHYVPFRRDLGDLMDKLQWAKDHDEEAQKIAKEGQEFIRNNLMSEKIFCYYQSLLEAYAKRHTSVPKIRQGMELVEQPKDDLFPCTCHRKLQVCNIMLHASSLQTALPPQHHQHSVDGYSEGHVQMLLKIT
uniref:Protein O-glucosyltransferase 2 n=1 Tax=Eptatretus burgeri TaxID=7764 RepID=A0A8C4NH19_EPTBU